MGTPVVPGASLEHRVPVPFSVVLRSGAGMKSSQTDRGITARSSTLTPEKTILATAAKHLRSGRSAWTGSADATVVNPRTRSVRAGIIAVGARVFQKRPLAFLRRRKKLLPGMQFTLPKVWSGASALKDAGIQVVCKTFLNAVTEPDFDALVSWCDANAIEHYSSSNMTQAYDGENLDKFKSKARAAPSMRRTTEAVCLPCKTKNYGSAINAAFQIFPCPTIRLADCTYDIRTHGVPEALSKMLQFMRRFQDTEIQGVPSDSNKCASCIAFAKPIRTDSGEISHFSQW
jgi:hypothetical protein